jgi:hypothetical protein
VKTKFVLFIIIGAVGIANAFAPPAIGAVAPAPDDAQIEKVHVIFKTHLDIGFTHLPSKVEQTYINNFIPGAIAVGERLRAEGSPHRYIWTTGSWLIDAYLKNASPEAVKKLEAAIQRGDIVWNGVPYSMQSEAANKDVFSTSLKLAKRLDEKYGKKTLAAKMTDVPGHTRGIISPLYDAGFRFLHIGVNVGSAVPQVPPICKWRNTDGKEIILMYQNDYGGHIVLPDGKTVVSIVFTGDNHGPHKVAQVKTIFASLQKRYPNAKVAASTLNAVAEELQTMSDKLPVVTSEIGDTWIYGYASSPLMMARFRALSRLYSEWLRTGKIDKESDTAIDFCVKLGLVVEHTWGVDVKSHIRNWNKYDVDAFNAARQLPAFQFAEQSWREKAGRVDQAIALLPANLQKEANAALENIGKAQPQKIATPTDVPQLNSQGAFSLSLNGTEGVLGEIAYQTFSTADYTAFIKAYTRGSQSWITSDFGKDGLVKSKAKSATIVAQKGRVSTRKTGGQETLDCIFSFPDDARIDSRVFPEQVNTRYVVSENGKRIEMTVSLVNKPAVRLPEAYWVSFVPEKIQSIVVEKMGYPVDVLDVVQGGNRQMHGIDNYVDLKTTQGTIRITSLDAPLLVIGERNLLNYSHALPDLKKGVHFCLFNNTWGTNFTMWWEGNLSYRFVVEIL